MQHCYFLFGSHSLSALIPDRWREGRVGAKRLSPQAGRAGGGCFVSMVCVGKEAAGGLAAWPPRTLFPRNLGVGSTWMLWGRKAGQGVSLPPAWLAVPWPLHTKDRCCSLSLDVGGGQGLWGQGLSCGQGRSWGSQRALRAQAGCLLGQSLTPVCTVVGFLELPSWLEAPCISYRPQQRLDSPDLGLI